MTEYRIPLIVTDEMWTTITEFIVKGVKYRVRNNKYEISSHGNLKRNGEMMPFFLYKSGGYPRLELPVYKGNKKTWVKVLLHRLVAHYFIPNPENKPTVNHILGDTKDNRYWMLEWATQKEQIIHAHRIGLSSGVKGSKHYTSLFTEEQVEIICTMIDRGYRNKDIAKIIPLRDSRRKYMKNISNIRHGKNWAHVSMKYEFRRGVAQ